MNFLLFDFGASRIKSIFFDTKNDELSELYSTPGASLDNINQVPIEFFLESFQQHLSYRKSKNKKRGVRVRFQSKNDLILGSIDSDASTIVT